MDRQPPAAQRRGRPLTMGREFRVTSPSDSACRPRIRTAWSARRSTWRRRRSSIPARCEAGNDRHADRAPYVPGGKRCAGTTRPARVPATRSTRGCVANRRSERSTRYPSAGRSRVDRIGGRGPASDRRGDAAAAQRGAGSPRCWAGGRARTTYVDIAYVLGLAREAAKAFGDKGRLCAWGRSRSSTRSPSAAQSSQARDRTGPGTAGREEGSTIGRIGLQTGARLGRSS